jgi:ABC-type methionine transport system ATPase subunit
MKQALDLIFPQNLIKELVIHKMSHEFDVVFNLRRAKITDKVGQIVLELEGDEVVLRKAVEWLKKQGLKVEPVTHDALES